MLPFRINTTKRYAFLLAAALCTGILFLSPASVVCAASVDEVLELRRAMPVQSNQVPDWPNGPVVGAESALLMDAETGSILYSKNIYQRQYPASTTKLMTSLLVSERCELDEIVTFSYNAVFDTPWDSSHIAMDVGQELTVEQCLQAMLIRSANEVSFAVAEHITGSTNWLDFAEIMNTRAEELGCLDTHFVNPNGLQDENHYTTAYDLAIIGKAFFANEMLCKITLSRRMEFPATEKLPLGKLENSHMQIIPGGTYAYEYLVGCKTGFTDEAGNCLVSCAEKNGMRLICVVLHDTDPYQYEDTIALFEYGFSNFEKVNVSQSETKYNIGNTGLFYSGNDIFGNSRPLLSIDRNDCIILPKTVSFENLESAIRFGAVGEDHAGVISYSYQGMNLGTVRINFATEKEEAYAFDLLPGKEEDPEESQSGGVPVLVVNIKVILISVSAIAVLLFVTVLVRAILRNYAFSGRQHREQRSRRGRRR